MAGESETVEGTDALGAGGRVPRGLSRREWAGMGSEG